MPKTESYVAHWTTPNGKGLMRHFTSRSEALYFLLNARFPLEVTNRDRRVVGWSQRGKTSSAPHLARWIFVWEEPISQLTEDGNELIGKEEQEGEEE